MSIQLGMHKYFSRIKSSVLEHVFDAMKFFYLVSINALFVK